MLLYEYQAKALFAQAGVPIPRGINAVTHEELSAGLPGLAYPLFLKAQVLSGGRGKAGAVKKASDAAEALRHFETIKSMTVKSYQNSGQALTVPSVLAEEGQALDSEFYLAIILDRARSKPVLIASRGGGMDVEELSRTDPTNLLTLDLDINSGMTAVQCQTVHTFYNHPKVFSADTAVFLKALFSVFLKHDALMVEVNPLAVTASGKLVALDAKISLDENAEFRHPEWAPYLPQNIVHPEEEEAAKFGLSYVKLDNGTIGCMVNGAGLAMGTMDLIALYGGKPANFLDVGGRATVESTAAAFRILTRDPSVKVILVNIFGGIVQCDLIAQGILTASETVKLAIPLTIRLEGTNADKGLALIRESGRPWTVERDLNKAVQHAVRIAEGK